ncbi:MAG: hypothetical protein ACP5OZ_02125 [Candidatus Woesearchaeota archaeon]
MKLSDKIVAFGIAILLTILVFLLIDFVYPQPNNYYDYYNDCYYRFNCDKSLIDCERMFEQHSIDYEARVNECRNEILKSEEYRKCLNEQNLCSQESFRNSAFYAYSKISFLILVVIGVILILTSMFLIFVDAIRAGFMLSGIMVIIISTLKSWSYLMYNKGLSIFMILLALLLLIFYSYKNNIQNNIFGKVVKTKEFKKI